MDKKKRITGIILIMAVAAIMGITACYRWYIDHILDEETSIYAQELAGQSVKLIRERIGNDFLYLEGLAQSLGSYDKSLDTPEVMDMLKRRMTRTRFTRLMTVDEKGQMYNSSTGEVYDASQQDFYKKSMKGETTVWNFKMENLLEQVIVISVPVYREDQVIGMVAGTYSMSELESLMSMEYFGGEGYNYIARSNGDILVSSEFAQAKSNVVEDFSKTGGNDLQEEDIRAIIGDMKDGRNGYITYTREKREYILSYVSVEINDWYFLLVAPCSVINEKAVGIDKITLFYCTGLLLILGLVALRIYVCWNTCRIEKEKLQAEMDAVCSVSPDALVRFTSEEGLPVLYASDSFYELFKCSREEFQAKYGDRLESVICLEYRDWFYNLKEGDASLEFRTSDHENTIRWVSGKFVVQREKEILKVTCSLADISRQREELSDLERQARRDHLTSLKNQRALEYEIDDIMKECDYIGALLLMDLDNFKRINDKFGYGEGDKILQLFAACMKKTFKEKDFVGRLCGDEFVVFMCHVSRRELIKKKAEQLMETFQKELPDSMRSCKVTVSIGIAISPIDGSTYEVLHKKADKALYEAKDRGKDRYCFYKE